MFLHIIAVHAAQDAERILQSWKEEHKGYYAKHPRTLCVGYLPDGRDVVGAYAGFKLVKHGGSWLTSGGNFHYVTQDEKTLTMIYSGRRHGMRREFAELLEQVWGKAVSRVYLTQEPTWKPWETLDDYRDRPTLVPLVATDSRHYCGYDNDDGTRASAYSYAEGTRGPGSYLDDAVTHIWQRPDVEIQTNDTDGASVTFDPAKGCPFVAPRQDIEDLIARRDSDRAGEGQ